MHVDSVKDEHLTI